MGEGLKRVTLEALCTRGPWTTPDGPITGNDLRALYSAIAAGSLTPTVDVGLHVDNNRKADRALQLLKRSGLIMFGRSEPGQKKARWLIPERES